jgi:hypothetical protein
MNSIPITRVSIFFFILVVIAFASHCKKKMGRAPEAKTSAPAIETAKVAPAAADTFKISFSRGGGFTGLVRGYTLYSDGVVQHWQRMPAGPDSILWTMTVEPAQIQAFKQQLHDTGMLEKTLDETGNLTTVVLLESPRDHYRWSWSGVSPPEALPPAFKAWCDNMEAFCKNLKK